MSKKFFSVIILIFLVFLNTALIVVSYFFYRTILIKCLMGELFFTYSIVFIAAVYIWRKETECESKFRKDLLDTVKTTIRCEIKENSIYRMDKDEIKKLLDKVKDEIRREDNNNAFLRTLADAICCEDGKWNCKNIEKLLTAMNSISNCENKRTHAHWWNRFCRWIHN